MNSIASCSVIACNDPRRSSSKLFRIARRTPSLSVRANLFQELQRLIRLCFRSSPLDHRPRWCGSLPLRHSSPRMGQSHPQKATQQKEWQKQDDESHPQFLQRFSFARSVSSACLCSAGTGLPCLFRFKKLKPFTTKRAEVDSARKSTGASCNRFSVEPGWLFSSADSCAAKTIPWCQFLRHIGIDIPNGSGIPSYFQRRSLAAVRRRHHRDDPSGVPIPATDRS